MCVLSLNGFITTHCIMWLKKASQWHLVALKWVSYLCWSSCLLLTSCCSENYLYICIILGKIKDLLLFTSFYFYLIVIDENAVAYFSENKKFDYFLAQLTILFMKCSYLRSLNWNEIKYICLHQIRIINLHYSVLLGLFCAIWPIRSS